MKIFAAGIPADRGEIEHVIFAADSEQHALEILAREFGCEGPEVAELTPEWLDDYYSGIATLSTERS
jgi:hypothetical protein